MNPKQPITAIWIEHIIHTDMQPETNVTIWRGNKLNVYHHGGPGHRLNHKISKHSLKRARRAFKALKTKTKGGE